MLFVNNEIVGLIFEKNVWMVTGIYLFGSRFNVVRSVGRTFNLYMRCFGSPGRSSFINCSHLSDRNISITFTVVAISKSLEKLSPLHTNFSAT